MLDHLIALLDGLVEVLEEGHVRDVPAVPRLHLGHGELQVVVELFRDGEDLAEAVLLTGVLLFHLLEFGFEVLDPLGRLGGRHFEVANLEVLLHQEVVHGLFFDLTVDDFLLEDFDFCLGVNQLLLLLLVGGVELAQSVGFGLKGLFKLADADLVGHRAFVAHAHRPEPMLTCSTVLHPMKTTPQVRRLRRMERGTFLHRIPSVVPTA